MACKKLENQIEAEAIKEAKAIDKQLALIPRRYWKHNKSHVHKPVKQG